MSEMLRAQYVTSVDKVTLHVTLDFLGSPHFLILLILVHITPILYL